MDSEEYTDLPVMEQKLDADGNPITEGEIFLACGESLVFSPGTVIYVGEAGLRIQASAIPQDA